MDFLFLFLELFSNMFGFVFIGCIILIIISHKRAKRKSIELSKKELIKELFSRGVAFLIASFIFGIAGILMFIVGIECITSNFNVGIFAIMMGISFVLISSMVALKEIKPIIRVFRNKYVVVKDILKDKDEIWKKIGTSQNENRKTRYCFYFKDYFTKYNKQVIVYKTLYAKSKINDEFYLVFAKGLDIPLVYRCKNCKANEEILEKIIPIEDLKDFINIKEFKIDNEISNEKRKITKKECINDYTKEKRFTILFTFFTLIFLIFFMYMLLFKMDINKAAVILIILPFLLLGYMFIINVSTVYKVKSSIKHDKYTVKEDVIVAINERMDFKDTNNLIKLKFKNFKKNLVIKRKRISNAKIGDGVYLVFVKSETDPIGVYNKKSVNFDM